MSSVDVVVVDLVDSDGVAGLGFTYVIGGSGATVLAAAREQIAQHVLGRPSLPPQALWRTIAAGFGRTGLGPNLLALAAIDVAAGTSSPPGAARSLSAWRWAERLDLLRSTEAAASRHHSLPRTPPGSLQRTPQLDWAP